MKKVFILLGAMLLLLNGCDKLSILSQKDKTCTGYYVYGADSPLVGIDYQCGNIKGVTNKKGKFSFDSNSDCEFRVGSIKIRDVYSQELRDNIFLQEENQRVIKFLKSLTISKRGVVIDNLTKKALDALKIEEIPESDIILQATIDAVKSYLLKKNNKRLLSSI